MSVIYLIEPGSVGSTGSMGAYVVAEILRDHGHDVTHFRSQVPPSAVQMDMFGGLQAVASLDMMPRPDAVFISTIYVRQWMHLADVFRRLGLSPFRAQRTGKDPLVVFGGQTSYAPEPIAELADVVALGDGEITAAHIASMVGRMSKDQILEDLADRRGYWVTSEPPSLVRVETDAHTPRVMRVGTHGNRPTIEVARGCASKCAFCPIGWAGGTYREADEKSLRSSLAGIRGKAVNLFAPDYSSVTYVDRLDQYAESLGCRNTGVDARLDRAEKHLAAGGTVKRFAFGIEGMSERLRMAIGKPLSTDKIREMLTGPLSGMAVRMYMIVGLPGETDDDMREFQALIEDVGPRRTYAGMMDVTLTHLQAVPHTPLERVRQIYNEEAQARAMAYRAWAAEHRECKTLFTQPKGRELHESDSAIQRAPRELGRYLAVAHPREIDNGKWREGFRSVGLSVEHILREMTWEESTPWDYVDVGLPKSARRKAWDRYVRCMSGSAVEA